MRRLLLAVMLTAAVYCSAQCSITTTSLPGGIVGQNYSAAITGSCGTKASWNRLGGYPPLGLNISGSYGSITGKPALAGLYYFQMQLKGSGGTAVQDYWVSIVDPLTMSISQQTAPLPCGTLISAPFFSASGGLPPYKWSATGLPAGMTIDPNTGTISGIAPCQATSYQIQGTITVTDSGVQPLVAKLDFKM